MLANSVSNSHAEKRAADMRVNDWPDGLAEAFELNFNRKFAKNYGAPSYSDGVPRLIVVHGRGANRHAHIQVKKGLPKNALLEDF